MHKLPALKPKDIMTILGRAGFSFLRQKGSHKLYGKGATRVTVPVHNKDLRKGTLRHIIKQTGFTVQEFLKLFK